MTDTTKSIVGLIPTAMAVGLVGHNLDYIKFKKKKKSLLGLGMTNIVGTNLIQATAGAGSW